MALTEKIHAYTRCLKQPQLSSADSCSAQWVISNNHLLLQIRQGQQTLLVWPTKSWPRCVHLMFNSETHSLTESSVGYITGYITVQLIFGLSASLSEQVNSAVNFQRKQQLCCPHPPAVQCKAPLTSWVLFWIRRNSGFQLLHSLRSPGFHTWKMRWVFRGTSTK